MKICQYLLSLPPCPHVLWPPTGVAPHDPGGSLCPCSPPASPCLPLLSPPDPVRPSYNTWPRPRDGTVGVQGKCPFLWVRLWAALRPLTGPRPIITCTALFFRTFSHTQTESHTHTFILQAFSWKDMTCWKWRLSFLWCFSIVIKSDRWLLFTHLCHAISLLFFIAQIDSSGSLSGLERESEDVKKFKATCV